MGAEAKIIKLKERSAASPLLSPVFTRIALLLIPVRIDIYGQGRKYIKI